MTVGKLVLAIQNAPAASKALWRVVEELGRLSKADQWLETGVQSVSSDAKEPELNAAAGMALRALAVNTFDKLLAHGMSATAAQIKLRKLTELAQEVAT